MEEYADQGIFNRLRDMIGLDGQYQGRPCRLIDILAEEGQVVLEIRELTPPIQTDQYGQASFRSNEILELPIFSGDRMQLSEELTDLLASIGERGARELMA